MKKQDRVKLKKSIERGMANIKRISTHFRKVPRQRPYDINGKRRADAGVHYVYRKGTNPQHRNTNKFTRHQGVQECERRRARMGYTH